MRFNVVVLIGLFVIIGLFVVTGCSTVEPLPTDTPEPTTLPFFMNALSLRLPGMEQVQVQNVQYSSFGDKPLSMDLYYPIDGGDTSGYPVVVFVSGSRTSAYDLRNDRVSQSWGRLVAADGMLGVNYDTV